jgi:cell division protein FtsI/penicillin-binding protein 2
MSTELRRARSRQMVIFLLVFLGMTALLGRLYYWQIAMGGDLAKQANAEHVQNQVLDAPRGLIYDAQGRLLATNVVRDDVYVEPIQFASDFSDNYPGKRDELINALRQVLPQLSIEQLQEAFGSNRQSIRIARAIDPGQSKRLRDLQLPDIFLQSRTVRTYPVGNIDAQILGYVQQDGKGVNGIEEKYNTLLTGKAGSLTAETDLNGNPLTVGSSSGEAPVNGDDITLTIDNTIQYVAQTELVNVIQQSGAQSGSVVVLNVHTGAIVALAGAPTFDPNHYGDYADQKGCIDTEAVYYNPNLYCAYEPGSTMKVFTMAAALDQHLITPDTTIQDEGCLRFSDGTPAVCNWSNKAYGTETMTQVLEHSANVGAAYVSTVLGPQRYYPYLQHFGFGTPTGLLGPEETGGYRTDQDRGWTWSDLTRQAFGQSITLTPIQLARGYQAIANGGVMMKPYLVASVKEKDHVTATQPQVQGQVINAATSKTLTQMLVSTAVANKVTLSDYSTAIKTGTATTQGVDENQTIASIAGYLPASNPEFVIVVRIDRPKSIYGSVVAAPLWKTIAQQLMWENNVPPDQQSGTP